MFAVTLAAATLGLLGQTPGTTASAQSPTSTPTLPPSFKVRPAYSISTELEQFVTDQSIALASIWAGSMLVGDERVEVALTTEEVPPILRRPDIVIVHRVRTQAELGRIMSTVSDKLRRLLAPGLTPGIDEDWPLGAQQNYEDNLIDIQIADASRRAGVERVLHDELKAGEVRVTYGNVVDIGPVARSRRRTAPTQSPTAPS